MGMIANVGPGSASVEHSLNTLRYAYRVKELKSGKPGAPAPDMSVGADYGQASNLQADLGIEEESSADEEGTSVMNASSQQQQRVAILSAAAQRIASPRDARLFEPRGGNMLQTGPDDSAGY